MFSITYRHLFRKWFRQTRRHYPKQSWRHTASRRMLILPNHTGNINTHYDIAAAQCKRSMTKHITSNFILMPFCIREHLCSELFPSFNHLLYLESSVSLPPPYNIHEYIHIYFAHLISAVNLLFVQQILTEHTENNNTLQNSITHWGRVTHICVSRLTMTGSDNGLSPGRRQAIIRTNAGILLIGSLGTNFSEFMKIRLKCRLRNGGHFVSASMR